MKPELAACGVLLGLSACGPGLSSEGADGSGTAHGSDTAGMASTALSGNTFGTLSTGSAADSTGGSGAGPPQPPQLPRPGPTDVARLCAGYGFSCALSGMGEVKCWGSADYGQLGQGSFEDIGDDEAVAPVAVVDLGGAAEDVVCGRNAVCAATTVGDVRCWGTGVALGSEAQSNVGDDEPPSSAPTTPLGGEVTGWAGGNANFFCAIIRGSVRCWGGPGNGLGIDFAGPLGDDEPVLSVAPVSLHGKTTVALAAGAEHACALTTDDELYCWGGSVLRFGETGFGSVDPDVLPEQLGSVPLDLVPAQVYAGGFMTCVRSATGSLKCWGVNAPGEAGGSPRNPLPAADVSDLDLGGPIVRAWAGTGLICADVEDEGIRCVGPAQAYMHGVGDPNVHELALADTPVLAFSNDVREIAIGSSHACAALIDGRAVCWGYGARGALGNQSSEAIGDDEPVTADMAFAVFQP